MKGKLIGQGYTAEIFEWGACKILKLYRRGLPDGICAHEFETTRAAYEALKIAPKPYETVNIDGRPGAVYERVNGVTLLRLMLLKLWRSDMYCKMFAECHASIHKFTCTMAETLKQKLRRDIENAPRLTAREKRFVLEYLEALPDGAAVCHFDFHPGNIMISKGRLYVIDWMTACAGDPPADVARTLLILGYSEIPGLPVFISRLTGKLKRDISGRYLREYIKLTGADPADIKKWELPVAAARLHEWIPEEESDKLLALVRRECKCQ